MTVTGVTAAQGDGRLALDGDWEAASGGLRVQARATGWHVRPVLLPAVAGPGGVIDVAGLLDLSLETTGTLAAPVGSGRFALRDARYGDLHPGAHQLVIEVVRVLAQRILGHPGADIGDAGFGQRVAEQEFRRALTGVAGEGEHALEHVRGALGIHAGAVQGVEADAIGLPSIAGMLMSISTTSGSSALTLASASVPVDASPTTCMSS